MSVDRTQPRREAGGRAVLGAGPLPVIGHAIAGRPDAGGSRRAPVYNPAMGSAIADVALAGRDEVERACKLRRPRSRAVERNARVEAGARAVQVQGAARKRITATLAAIVTREHGKVLADAHGEIDARPRGRRVRLRHSAAAEGRNSDNIGGGIDNWSLRQPLGVCVGITPFNFPAMVPMWMFPVAIACGNTFVLKPSERDPSRRSACGAPRRRRAAGWRLQRRAGRQGGGGRAARASGRRGRVASSARRRSPNTSTRTARVTASACRRWAARRTI